MCLRGFFNSLVFSGLIFFFTHRICVSNGSDYDLYSVSAGFYLPPFCNFSRDGFFSNSNGFLL